MPIFVRRIPPLLRLLQRLTRVAPNLGTQMLHQIVVSLDRELDTQVLLADTVAVAVGQIANITPQTRTARSSPAAPCATARDG